MPHLCLHSWEIPRGPLPGLPFKRRPGKPSLCRGEGTRGKMCFRLAFGCVKKMAPFKTTPCGKRFNKELFLLSPEAFLILTLPQPWPSQNSFTSEVYWQIWKNQLCSDLQIIYVLFDVKGRQAGRGRGRRQRRKEGKVFHRSSH